MKAGLHDWEMNLIQGMVNQLQIDYKALQTSSKGKKNQINTTYKVMEVSVKLCDQLLGFESNQSKNHKDREITDTFALFLSVYCTIAVSILHYSCQYIALLLSVYCTIPVSILHYCCQYIALYLSVYCTIPVSILHYSCQYIALYLSVYCTIPVSILHYSCQYIAVLKCLLRHVSHHIFDSSFFFTVVLCILMLSNFLLVQIMHNQFALKY